MNHKLLIFLLSALGMASSSPLTPEIRLRLENDLRIAESRSASTLDVIESQNRAMEKNHEPFLAFVACRDVDFQEPCGAWEEVPKPEVQGRCINFQSSINIGEDYDYNDRLSSIHVFGGFSCTFFE
jgi:hypothetical protein